MVPPTPGSGRAPARPGQDGVRLRKQGHFKNFEKAIKIFKMLQTCLKPSWKYEDVCSILKILINFANF